MQAISILSLLPGCYRAAIVDPMNRPVDITPHARVIGANLPIGNGPPISQAPTMAGEDD
jgi:hypothetical protein